MRVVDAVAGPVDLERCIAAVAMQESPPQVIGPFVYFAHTVASTSAVLPTELPTSADFQRLGAFLPETPVTAVRGRWPGLEEQAAAAGWSVRTQRLFSVDAEDWAPATTAIQVRAVTGERDIAASQAVAEVAFSRVAADTAGGLHERDEELRSLPAERLALLVRRVKEGRYKYFAAYIEGQLVSAADHVPVGETSVVYGVATLPDFRGRGLARAVVAAAVTDAFTLGVSTVVLWTGDERAAELYSSLGFRASGVVLTVLPPTTPI